jgi:hypothetical protein
MSDHNRVRWWWAAAKRWQMGVYQDKRVFEILEVPEERVGAISVTSIHKKIGSGGQGKVLYIMQVLGQGSKLGIGAVERVLD